MTIPACYLFSGLSESHSERIDALTMRKSVKHGTWLFHKGEPAEALYLVLGGGVELLIEVDRTIEIPIAMIRPGNGCVGVGALVPPFRYSLSARCATDCELLSMRRVELQTLMGDHPRMGSVIMANLAAKLMERLTETRQEIQLHFVNMVRTASL